MASNRTEITHSFSGHSREFDNGNNEHSAASTLHIKQRGQNSIKHNVEYDDINISDASSARSSSRSLQHQYIEQSTETELDSKRTATDSKLTSRIGESNHSVNRDERVFRNPVIVRSRSEQLQQRSRSPLLHESLPASPRPSGNLLRSQGWSLAAPRQTGSRSSSDQRDQGLRIVSEASSSLYDQQEEDIQHPMIGIANDSYYLDPEDDDTHNVRFKNVTSEAGKMSDTPAFASSPSSPPSKASQVARTSASSPSSSSKKGRKFKARLAKFFVKDEQASDESGKQIQVKHWTDDY